ncbi:MAG: sigma-70 family RNA polymerase sigma factor [Elusimicrobia bacterium]|nr:MAG: sigma-70 family RNA polymerase sigma factor [Elusimicrobiota bacterium]
MQDSSDPRPPRTDAELVAGLIARDRRCTEEFLALYTPRMQSAVARRFSRHALGRGLHVPDVQDCVQSLLLSLFERDAARLRSYRADEAPLGAWLWTVASNFASQQLASRARSGTHELPRSSSPQEPGVHSDRGAVGGALPTDEQDRLEARNELSVLFHELGSQLDESDRELIRLRFVEEEPTDVICAKLRLSSDALYQRLSRLRKLLRDAALRPASR